MKDFFKKEKPLQGWTGFGGGATSIRMGGAVSPYITATGGTKSTPGDGYIYHQFTSGGFFVVENAGVGPDGIIDLCVVGGGGGAGNDKGGGGGAGGFRITTVDISNYGAGTYSCGVGPGGSGNPSSGNMPTRSAGAPGEASYFQIPSVVSPSPFLILCGGGGGGGSTGGPPPSMSPTANSHGKPGQPYPFPTDSTPHPNSVYYPGSGGGSRRISSSSVNYGGAGAGADFNSYPGEHGPPSNAGGGGGAGSGGPESATTGEGGEGKQLPWALPTWGWGQNNPSGNSGQAPTSPDPTRPAGPTGQLPWDYGWFCGGGGGGGPSSSGQGGGAGAGNGAPPTSTWGGPPSTGTDGYGYWAAPGTGSGGGGAGGPSYPGGRGAPGAVMIRYPAA